MSNSYLEVTKSINSILNSSGNYAISGGNFNFTLSKSKLTDEEFVTKVIQLCGEVGKCFTETEIKMLKQGFNVEKYQMKDYIKSNVSFRESNLTCLFFKLDVDFKDDEIQCSLICQSANIDMREEWFKDSKRKKIEEILQKNFSKLRASQNIKTVKVLPSKRVTEIKLNKKNTDCTKKMLIMDKEEIEPFEQL